MLPIQIVKTDELTLVKRKYVTVEERAVHLKGVYLQQRDKYLEAKAMIKHWEKVVDETQLEILKAMTTASVAKLPDGGSFTRKLVNRKEMIIKACSYIDFRYKTS